MGAKITQESFLKRCFEVHANKYDYSLVEYTGMHTKVKIICKEHGVFEQAPNHHLKGTECSLCNKQRLKTLRIKSELYFEIKANEVHNFKYDYTDSIYYRSNHKIEILCKSHGVFTQTPSNHLRGHGCPSCNKTRKSKKENQLYLWLQTIANVDNLYKPKWLGKKELDIFVTSCNLAIEYNGLVYHHSSKNITDYYDRYTRSTTYHLDKYNLCKENNVNLIHIFEFEDLDIWKEKLQCYLKNPKNYEIIFKNDLRSIKHSNHILDVYGISEIKEINHGDLAE